MRYILGLIFLVLGGAITAGNRTASQVTAVDVWFWETLFGIEVTPMYRKASGVLWILFGFSLFIADYLAYALWR